MALSRGLTILYSHELKELVWLDIVSKVNDISTTFMELIIPQYVYFFEV